MAPNTWKRLLLVKLGLTMLALSGCAYVRNIPANSTSEREARYYRTQDVANFAGGIAVDELLRLWLKGPRPPTDTVWVGRYGYGHGQRNWDPVFRLGIIATVAVARRQLDKGYRESGAMFNVSGAMLWEIVRCTASRKCNRPVRR